MYSIFMQLIIEGFFLFAIYLTSYLMQLCSYLLHYSLHYFMHIFLENNFRWRKVKYTSNLRVDRYEGMSMSPDNT